MLKFVSILLSLGILFSPGKLNAQQKIAYIDGKELLLSMPETKIAEAEYKKVTDRMIAQYNGDVVKYNRADSLLKSDSAKWLPGIIDIKKEELALLKRRLEIQAGLWDGENKDLNDRLMAPINKRALDAIEAVVKENGYTKWVDKSEAVKHPGAKDIMLLVKKKLASTPNTFAEMTFENEEYNMGVVDEKRVTYDFKLTNSGNAPLIVRTASVDCEWLVLKWPLTPINPGESGIISVTYNGAGHAGAFSKSILIASNANRSPLSFTVKGYVGSYLKNQLTQQFLKIMLAFPGNFESLKGTLSDAAKSEYNSTVMIEQSRKTAILKGKEGKNNVLCLISSYDTKQKGYQQYQEWLRTINGITINGAVLKVYKTEENEIMSSTKWRLDNSKNNISKEYQPFTITLDFLYMDEKNAGLLISFGAD